MYPITNNQYQILYRLSFEKPKQIITRPFFAVNKYDNYDKKLLN